MSWNLFKKIVPDKSFLGIDIGTTSIKIVELSAGQDGRPQLMNYGLLETTAYLERFNTAIQTSTLNLFDQEVVGYLNLLLRRTAITTRRAIMSLPSFAVFTTLIEMPAMSEQETTKTMSLHVKQYVPMPLSSVTLDWIKVGERVDADSNRTQQIFLIAIPNNYIESYKRICAATGIQLLALEVEGVSLARALTTGYKDTALVVDIGSRSTALIVAADGVVKMIAQTDFAGATLTNSLASGLNIAPRRAEMLKRQKGISTLESGAERELSTQLLPMLDVILNEVKRVKDAYETTHHDTITSVILSGGGANLLGIEAYMAEQFGVPVTKADPLARVIYPETIGLIRADLGANLAVAIGLALRGF